MSQFPIAGSGRFGMMRWVLAEMLRYTRPDNVKAIALSRRDHDIVAGISTWSELTSSLVYGSKIWVRFFPIRHQSHGPFYRCPGQLHDLHSGARTRPASRSRFQLNGQINICDNEDLYFRNEHCRTGVKRSLKEIPGMMALGDGLVSLESQNGIASGVAIHIEQTAVSFGRLERASLASGGVGMAMTGKWKRYGEESA